MVNTGVDLRIRELFVPGNNAHLIYRRSLFSVFGFVYAGFYSVDCFTMDACREQSYYFPYFIFPIVRLIFEYMSYC